MTMRRSHDHNHGLQAVVMSLLNAVAAKPEAFGPYGGKVEMNDGKHEVIARTIFMEGAIGTNRMAVDLRRAWPPRQEMDG